MLEMLEEMLELDVNFFLLIILARQSLYRNSAQGFTKVNHSSFPVHFLVFCKS